MKQTKKNHQNSSSKSPLSLHKVSESSCKTFNADLVRSLISRKMLKQKTFYELKILPQAQLQAAQMSPVHFGGGAGMHQNFVNSQVALSNNINGLMPVGAVVVRRGQPSPT